MGEEQKETDSTEQEEKKEEEPSEIVLKVDMHCEGCARKVEKSLRKFEGVEEVKTDSTSNTVVVKGKTADPVKVCERVQKKTGKKVELISPLPKPPEEEQEKKELVEEEKKEEPKSITVVLKVRMHCEACAQHLQKRIKKMEGVESVVTDLSNDQVIVKGIIDPGVLVEKVYRRTRKQASIVQEEKKEEEKKPEEEQKEEEKKPEEEQKEEEKKPEEEQNEEEKKPEEEQKEEEKKPEEEEKKEENKEEEKKEGEEGHEANKYEHWPYPVEYAYTPHVFSDENPNACSVM